MLAPNVDHTSDWAGEARDLIVVCIDLYDSMGGRLSREARPRSEVFLRHNGLVYECVRDWQSGELGRRAGIELVNFVGDAGLVTFSGDSAAAAVEFSCDVVERVRRDNLMTSVGMDVGEVSVLELCDACDGPMGIRHAVGFAVDRAVRLSWIAAPGQILATSAVSTGVGSLGFDLLPTTDAIGVTLDKWPDSQNAWGGVRVHAVERRVSGRVGTPTRPANRRKLIEYFRRLQLEAGDFLRVAPNYWHAALNQFKSAEQWHVRLALDDMIDLLERSRRMDNSRIPELDGLRDGALDCLEEFVSWREGLLTTLQDLRGNYSKISRASLEELNFEEGVQRLAGNVIIFCIATLKRLSD